MTDKANANEDVRALFLGTMPERHDDVARLLEPEGDIAEEMECDRFAIDFLLAGSDA